MNYQPTPDEARRALQDVENRRQQTVAAGASSTWWWIVGGILTAGLGILFDLKPGIADGWGIQIGLLLAMVVALVRRSRWSGRRTGTRLAGNVGRQLGFGMILLVVTVVLFVAFYWFDIPHLSAVLGIVGGLFVILAGPWWERRTLQRNARR
ncbi:MAG: hypothetical protein QOC94_3640 [Actinoplanes sp.]|jgi:peptidoglycan/LPS O-acetylase OafA/YrhL|nr:hypothetical protein [Actinoplanes sp.]